MVGQRDAAGPVPQGSKSADNHCDQRSIGTHSKAYGSQPATTVQCLRGRRLTGTATEAEHGSRR